MKKGEKYILQKSFEGANRNYEPGAEFEVTSKDTERVYMKSDKEDLNYNIEYHAFDLYFKPSAKHIEISL